MRPTRGLRDCTRCRASSTCLRLWFKFGVLRCVAKNQASHPTAAVWKFPPHWPQTPRAELRADVSAAWSARCSGRATGTRARAAQYVTPRTVEVHLTSVYRKLGIPGRAGLSDALAR
jgi:hypothetical protein